MDFNLTKQEELFLKMIREFAEKEVEPLAAENDDRERFPLETVEKMRRIGRHKPDLLDGRRRALTRMRHHRRSCLGAYFALHRPHF